MRSRPRRDSDDEFLTHPPGDSSDDAPEEDDSDDKSADPAEEPVDDEPDEHRQRWNLLDDERGGPPHFDRCGVCGRSSPRGADVLAVCSRHLGAELAHDPRTSTCARLEGHHPCIGLAVYKSFCALPWCGARIFCWGDAGRVHRSCLGQQLRGPPCAEPGCNAPPVGQSSRCRLHRKLASREATRLRVARFRKGLPKSRGGNAPRTKP